MNSRARFGLRLCWAPALLFWSGCAQPSDPTGAFERNAARLAAMSPSELAEVRRKMGAFSALSPAEQQRLRDLDAAIHTQEQPSRLLATWRDYNRWLGETGAADPQVKNAILQSPTPTERVATVTREVTRRRQRNFGLESEDRLPEGDWPAFNSWLRATGSAKLRDLRRENPNLPSEFNPNDRRMLRSGILSQIGPEDFEQLSQTLSEPGAAILARKPDREEKIRVVIAWWISYFLQIPPEDLQRFLKELPPATRLYIEQLGPEQGQLELKRRYLDDLRRRQ